MPEVMQDVLAVSDKRAAQIAGITMRQIRYWEQIGLVVPSVRRALGERRTVRLYSFRDLVELVVAAELRHRPGISLQHIQRLADFLRGQEFAGPLRELRFATRGREIYVQYPDGTWSGDPRPGQLIYSQAIALDLVGARISAAAGREQEAAGQVVTRRGVQGGKPIFAGTRIPVAVVQRYLVAGYDAAAIVEEYPSLSEADVEVARQLMAAS